VQIDPAYNIDDLANKQMTLFEPEPSEDFEILWSNYFLKEALGYVLSVSKENIVIYTATGRVIKPATTSSTSPTNNKTFVIILIIIVIIFIYYR
jgi:hypothetical protein